MLDSGKINYIPYQNSYYLIRAELCLMNLQKCGDKGVLIENGIVVEKEKNFWKPLVNIILRIIHVVVML
ncbi:MAG: hypothetical protein IPF75_14675 [Bacteroidetes bacterium]|nr:hypothetical protein [Bacteroidota bacterium]